MKTAHVPQLRSRLTTALLCAALLCMARPASASPIDWLGVTDIAAGDGEKGPWRQNDSRYRYVDDPSVQIDERGQVTVAWVDQTRKDVFVQRLSPDGRRQFAEPVNVSRSPQTFSWLPRMARAPDVPDKLFVVWQEIIFSGGSHGGDILFARSDDHGATFSAPVNLSHSIGGDGKGRINRDIWHNGSFDLAAGPNGVVHVVWTEYDGPLWHSRSLDGGRSFSAPRRIGRGADPRPARAPSLALDAAGTLHVAWTSGEDDGADIQVARSTDGGQTFSAPLVVAPSDRYADAPRLAAGPDGLLHLVYAYSESGPFAGFTIRYTRSRDGGRSFETPRDIFSPLPAGIDSMRYPALAIDGAGRLYVVCELYPRHDRDPRGLAIAMSPNAGQRFLAREIVPDSAGPDGASNGSHQGLLMTKLAVNRDGAIAIVNSSLLPGRESRVWMIRGQVRPATVDGPAR
jgi:hypothetical protein